jgi:septal ring factor EnvC (AmiA/AmiB activator)
MTAKPNKPESENAETVSPAPASEQPTPELEHAETETFPVQVEKPQKMGRFQRILRLALIGLVAVAVVFLAGFLTDHFARYSPMKAGLTENLTQMQAELSQAKQSIADLQSQVNDLSAQLATANDRISALEQDKENLQADLDSANLHIELLRTLVELKTAHVELQNDNLSGAKVALSGTAARLGTLKPLIETVDANLAASLQTRLNLILDGMDTNSSTAQADLVLLANNLQSVETLLFGKK